MVNQFAIGTPHLKFAFVHPYSITILLLGKPLRVGNKPGVTRHMETKIRVSDTPLVYLIDTPGISLPNIRNIEMGMKLAACGKNFI